MWCGGEGGNMIKGFYVEKFVFEKLNLELFVKVNVNSFRYFGR